MGPLSSRLRSLESLFTSIVNQTTVTRVVWFTRLMIINIINSDDLELVIARARNSALQRNSTMSKEFHVHVLNMSISCSL